MGDPGTDEERRTVPVTGTEGTPDGELARRAAAGDREAFALLHDRYARSIGAYLRSRGIAEADLPDLAQEVFMEAYRGMERLTDPDAIGGFLFGIARHRAADRHRRAVRDRVGTGEDSSDRSDVFPGPVEAAAAAERRRRVREAVDALPEGARQAIVLRYFDGLKCREIAASLGMPLGTVLSHLSRAHTRLASELEGVA